MATPRLTEEQKAEALQLVEEKGNIREAAKHLKMPYETFRGRYARARDELSDERLEAHRTAVNGVQVGGDVSKTSTLYGPDGEVKLQWVGRQADKATILKEIEEAAEAFKDRLPREKPVKAKKRKSTDLLNLHVLTDYHLGMYAWGEETGEDWDIKIADELLVKWFSLAIDQAPDADVGVLAQLGDFLHWDGMDAVTPASKHLLDADTRFQLVVRVAIKALRRLIRLMLEKYPTVHVLMADANHDPASAVWLREMFHAFYEDEPRVVVDNNADTYYCLEWGLTSLFFHHGHKRRPSKVDDVFVAKYRDVFGRTKHSYAHLGHMHSELALETNLMVVEQHRTMASKDAYASKGGWISGRSAKVITYSKQHGKVGEQQITPEML